MWEDEIGFRVMGNISVEEARDYLREMCYYYNGLIEGDDPHERAFEIMRELGLIDEETMEWIDNEAETRTSPKTKSNDV